MTWLWHEFLHITGVSNASGHWYAWWSGIVGDLALLAILGGMYRKLNCHVDGCRRIGLHHVPGTPYITCRRHHPTTPDGAITAAHIAARHDEANQ